MSQTQGLPEPKAVTTPYGDISAELAAKLKRVQLLALDVDGIFSDGRIYLGNQGEELKAFHTLDGYGVKAIQKVGLQVAVITGRQSRIVEQRMTGLGVKHIIQGEEHKADALQRLQHSLGIDKNATAAAGDDMPDLGMFAHSSLAFSVSSGHPVVVEQADYVCRSAAGFGAVREMCDLLLLSRDALYTSHGSST